MHTKFTIVPNMECALGCDTCGFLWAGKSARAADAWLPQCCLSPLPRRTLDYWVDSCEATLLSQFCTAVAENKPPPEPIRQYALYPGSLAVEVIRTSGRVRLSAFEILLEGPRALFLKAAAFIEQKNAGMLISQPALLSRYAAISLAMCTHISVSDVVIECVRKKKITVVTELLQRRPEALVVATREAWKSSSAKPEDIYMRKLTLRPESAHEAAISCARLGYIHMFKKILMKHPLSIWGVQKVGRVEAGAKPESKASDMVLMIKQITRQDMTHAINLAAAAGNAGAALIASDFKSLHEPLIQDAALRAAYNYYYECAKILAPKNPHHNLLATMIVKCNMPRFKWYPPLETTRLSEYNCLWPLVRASPAACDRRVRPGPPSEKFALVFTARRVLFRRHRGCRL